MGACEAPERFRLATVPDAAAVDKWRCRGSGNSTVFGDFGEVLGRTNALDPRVS